MAQENDAITESTELQAEDLITLEHEGGKEVDYIVVAIIDHGDRTFAILAAKDDEEVMTVLQYDELDDGSTELVPISDPNLLTALQAVIDDLLGLDPSEE